MNRYNSIQISAQLSESFQAFATSIKSIEATDFENMPDGKWSAGQHLDHLIKSVKPINQAFLLPKFLLKIIFGKANRPSLSYDELVGKYLSKLAAGGVATGAFVPPLIVSAQKEKLLKAYENQGIQLANTIKKWSEEELDTLIAPHPLLGKITIRELMYFTIYHTQHHLSILEKRA